MRDEAFLRARWARIVAELEATFGSKAAHLGSFEDFYGAPFEGRCSFCGGEVDEDEIHMAEAHVTDFGRLNTHLVAGFCSESCFATWFATPAGDFLPVAAAPGDLSPHDRGICFSLVHYRGPYVHDEPRVICHPDGGVLHLTFGDLVLQAWLPDAAALNAWWRAADRLVGEGFELLYLAEAA